MGATGKKPGPQLWSLTKLRACSELEPRATEVSDFSLFSTSCPPPPKLPANLPSFLWSCRMRGESWRSGAPRPDRWQPAFKLLLPHHVHHRHTAQLQAPPRSPSAWNRQACSERWKVSITLAGAKPALWLTVSS